MDGGSDRSGKESYVLPAQGVEGSSIVKGSFMDFARGSDGEVEQQFRHGSASFANPTPPTGAAERSPPGPSANDPQVRLQSSRCRRRSRSDNPLTSGKFDIFDWYPKYQSCQRYFVNHAQQSNPVQAVAAFVNITLPFERASNPIAGPEPRLSPGGMARGGFLPHQSYTAVSLVPYLRRLVVTGLDYPGVLHGFFGDDWATGVGPLHEQERRNYLFAAKSGGWASVKKDYDMLPLETVPFMRPLQGPVIAEIEAAEKSWSEWLAMEDWMVGPRAPENMEHGGASGGGEQSQPEGTR